MIYANNLLLCHSFIFWLNLLRARELDSYPSSFHVNVFSLSLMDDYLQELGTSSHGLVVLFH